MLNQLIPVRNYKGVAGSLFAYLFGKINKSEFVKQVADPALSKLVWANVKKGEHSGYVLKNCKLYSWAVHMARLDGTTLPSPGKFEIYQADVQVLRRLDLSRIPKHKAYSLFDYDLMVAATLQDRKLREWLGKYISRKLIFLRSYGLDRSDIESHLIEIAVFALAKQYPWYQSDLHITNICKTAMHNAGMGLIEYHTRNKRQNLYVDQGHFQSVTTPLDALNNLSVEPEHADEKRVALQGLVAVSASLKPRARTFVVAAAGLHHVGFSVFLGRDNQDAVDELPYPKYLDKLRAYLGVTAEQEQKLMAHLRHHL